LGCESSAVVCINFRHHCENCSTRVYPWLLIVCVKNWSIKWVNVLRKFARDRLVKSTSVIEFLNLIVLMADLALVILDLHYGHY
jgi:hypothetical protein